LEFTADVDTHNSNYIDCCLLAISPAKPNERAVAGHATVLRASSSGPLECHRCHRGFRHAARWDGKGKCRERRCKFEDDSARNRFRAIPTAQPVGIRHFVRRMSKDCGAGSYARHTACSLRKSGVQESQPPKQLEGAGTTPKDAEIRKLKGLLAATISENEERRSLHCPPGMCPLRHASSPRSSVWSARPSNSNLHRADAVASATASHLCVHSSESSQK
jgi:hypothetical protein